MPEGHTIHRYARHHQRDFGGQRLAISSPQGRFSAGAERLHGQELVRVDAAGKHLFYSFDGGDIMHVHLGLFGKFRTHRTDNGPPPLPTDGTRLTMEGRDKVVYLAGPNNCDLIDPGEEDRLRSRLGPDPLLDADQSDEFADRLTRRKIPIGAAILNQAVVAGVGNVYRAEMLFLAGIDPRRPANSLTPGEVSRLWDVIVAELRAGLRMGRIVTVDPPDVDRRYRSRLPRGERLYAYHRDGEPCRRCGTEINKLEMGGRYIWWCPSCQR